MSINPAALYQIAQIRQLEMRAIQQLNLLNKTAAPQAASSPRQMRNGQMENHPNTLSGQGILMERAGQAAWEALLQHWPTVKRLVVVCGTGNNGGDGYVVARLAHQAGIQVKILELTATRSPRPELVQQMAKCCSQESITTLPFAPQELEAGEVIVDAILGIGFQGDLDEPLQAAITAINASSWPVLSLDLPSGVAADSGRVASVAVQATVTVTFLGKKLGLWVGPGRNWSGIIVEADLGVPAQLWKNLPPAAQLVELTQELQSLPARQITAHKGDFGPVVVIGGDYGMGGAVRMAGEAALRVGAGLVIVATREAHVGAISAARPEIMGYGINHAQQLLPLLRRAKVVVIGPGLGQSAWGLALWQEVLRTNLPMVVDADGLNFLAQTTEHRNNWVLTPHLGEASRLLRTKPADLQNDRLAAVGQLQLQRGGVSVLKGSGTLIAAPEQPLVALCHAGNPGMASGGMGDILSGVIAGLMAQGLTAAPAARLGVVLHATAGDRLAQLHGIRGMAALDLLPEIRQLLNQTSPASAHNNKRKEQERRL